MNNPLGANLKPWRNLRKSKLLIMAVIECDCLKLAIKYLVLIGIYDTHNDCKSIMTVTVNG